MNCLALQCISRQFILIRTVFAYLKRNNVVLDFGFHLLEGGIDFPDKVLFPVLRLLRLDAHTCFENFHYCGLSRY